MDPQLKEALGNHAHDEADEREKLTFDTGDKDLAASFQNIDRNRDGTVSIDDLLKELNRINPSLALFDQMRYTEFLQLIMPEYSSSKKCVWTFKEFEHFMYDAFRLEKNLKKNEPHHHHEEAQKPAEAKDQPV